MYPQLSIPRGLAAVFVDQPSCSLDSEPTPMRCPRSNVHCGFRDSETSSQQVQTDCAGGLDVAATSYLREGRLRWLLTPHPACATAVALATLSPQTGEGAYGF